MPLIEVKMIEEVFTPAQKKELIAKLTDAVVALEGEALRPSKLEFGVIEYLQMHAGKAVSRISLLENVWQQRFDGGSNVVDVVVRSLRKKLGEKASVIETVQGIGYRLRREN